MYMYRTIGRCRDDTHVSACQATVSATIDKGLTKLLLVLGYAIGNSTCVDNTGTISTTFAGFRASSTRGHHMT
jgi:hypothetical protein